MIFSRFILALFAGLQLLTAGHLINGRAGDLLCALFIVGGGISALACSFVPTRPLCLSSAGINLGNCCFLACVIFIRIGSRDVDVGVNMLRIFGSVPLCAALLAGWIWLKCPQPTGV
jgi:hypothetical protein